MIHRYFLTLLTTLWLLGFSLPSNAQLPVDPTVVHGSALIDVVGHHMTVINNPNTILDWQSFSIGPNDSVYFQQLDTTSQILNRVTGNDPSQLLGSLGSNGSVWLVNPYGVLFGPEARIDVAGLIVSSLDISNIDFLANRYYFNSSGATGEVKNQGEIRTSFGGRVWLMGDRVQNEGVIQVPSGQIVLAAGKSIELIDSGVPNVVVRLKAPENEAVNLGSLVASSGNVDVHGSIVNQEGIIRANSVGTDATGRLVLKADQVTFAANSQTQTDNDSIQAEANNTLNNLGAINGDHITLVANEILQQGQITAQGGSVTLTANTSTYLDGLVDVSNLQGTGGNIRLTTDRMEGMAGGVLRADGQQGGNIQVEGRSTVAFSSTLVATGSTQGGKIEVTGDRVSLLNADIDASGNTQGGTVHLGGGWQGGGELSHAREVLVGVGSEVKANGGTNANAKGGEIAVWSTQSSEHYGSLQAKDGGRIELSSQGEIRQTGDIQVGAGGNVLFDPKNIIITDTPDNLTLARTIISGSVNGKPELVGGENFGTSIALSGDRLAVGAPRDDSEGHDGGVVHLFTGMETGNMTGLTWQKMLTSSTGASGMPLPLLKDFDFFGTAVALDGDRLAVGARGNILSDGNPGAVHLFNGVGTDFSGLTWQKTLTPGTNDMPESEVFDFFGTSLAMDGDRLAVGASGDSTNGSNQGAVHLFTGVGINFSGLHWQKQLSSDAGAINMPELANSNFFGWSLALDGDRLAVGAIGDSANRGAAHLFTGVGANFSGLTWQKKLSSSDVGVNGLAASDFFGWSLALDGERMVVGTFGDNANRGAVHVFAGVGTNFSKPIWQQKLAPGDGTNNMSSLAGGSGFGWSLAMDGDRLAVGALSNNGGESAVYLFNGISKFGNDVTDAIFAANASATSYITPALITSLLNTGALVTLQANNDISVQSAINVEKSGIGGNFILQAGRNISFDANITTNNGDFTAIAGDSGAMAEIRDPGTPTVTIAKNVSLNVGSGIAMIAAVNGDFINNNGDSAIVTDGNGRWLVYASNPTSSLEGFSPTTSYTRGLNQSFAFGKIPDMANNGNWFFYNNVGDLSPSQRQPTIDTLVQIINTSVTSSIAVLDGAAAGKVIDLMSSKPSFGRLNLASMSPEEMQLLVNDRKEFKQNLFADAIYKTELDPSLSEIPICSSKTEIDSGLCRISADQSREIKSKNAQAQPLIHKGKYKTRIASIPQIEQKFAVFIGIDQYVDKTIPSLENATNDAEVVGQLFADKLGYEILILKNATKAEIVRTLNQLSIEMGKNDSVVVYYAGHGYQNEKTGTGYWIPSDASAKDPTSWISNTSISEMLGGINSKQILMISDSCYSGTFTKEQELRLSDIDVKPVDILSQRSVVAMSSGGDEPVADEGKGGHSIFAWSLMQALRNIDNWKPGHNIFVQVQREVKKYFPQTARYGAIISAGHIAGDNLLEFRQLEEMK